MFFQGLYQRGSDGARALQGQQNLLDGWSFLCGVLSLPGNHQSLMLQGVRVLAPPIHACSQEGMEAASVTPTHIGGSLLLHRVYAARPCCTETLVPSWCLPTGTEYQLWFWNLEQVALPHMTVNTCLWNQRRVSPV